MEKSQKWEEAEPSTQCPFQKKNFGTSGEKLHKNRYQSFLPRAVLFGLDIVSLILFAIIGFN